MVIALRGHDESVASLNKGNFREIFDILAGHDSVIKERLVSGPHNATYFSPEIQNMFLKIMGDMVRKWVVGGVKKAVYFSLLADESKDASKKEQLAIILRSVDEKAIIHERFLTYVEAKSLTAKSLTSYNTVYSEYL